ncbi:helix-turn-helix domain-containing protein [Bacillus lacus]|uniref:Helix-turn-helix domain-containing protein n=1 Tax=Metabacillus lacus TaxID=1983721 RepID=A0A7X2J1K1_9BACI|nr:helix-turn-helix transcriptional regulator [Metabacillus lacus]MRX73690.1 helix-turn-helix domain-containing protein [Metabacillus lacus]
MRNNVTNKVKELRTSNKLTQAELAEKIGVTRLTIISMEKQNYEPTVGLALKIAKEFECTVEDIFEVGE